MTTKQRLASYLSPHQMHRLDLACKPLAHVGFGPYLVGSVNERPDYRDVDVRLILSDEEWDAKFGPIADERGEAHHDSFWLVVCAALSHWLSDVSGLPIDFQIQRQSEANNYYDGFCNPLGRTRPWTR